MDERSLWFVVVATIVLAFAVGGYGIHKANIAAGEARSVACAADAAAKKNIDNTEQFIREHPHGGLGLNHKQLVLVLNRSIAIQRANRRAYKGAHCVS